MRSPCSKTPFHVCTDYVNKHEEEHVVSRVGYCLTVGDISFAVLINS